jgi:CheY-like chemotaxis protein
MVDAKSEPVVRRRTVLVVDDDPGTRHVMASGIGEVLGTFDVVTAENGREATEVLETRRIDALATDLAMPVMDGFSLIAYVSNRKEALPVVAFSGLAADEIDERLSSYGGLRVLRKPVSYHEVAAALEDELGRIEKGQVAGIPLVALMQLVEIERRTCTAVVTSDRRRGRLYFQSGRLIDAYSDDFGADGEAAAYDILGWTDTSVTFDALPNGVRPKIDTPLQRMLL